MTRRGHPGPPDALAPVRLRATWSLLRSKAALAERLRQDAQAAARLTGLQAQMAQSQDIPRPGEIIDPALADLRRSDHGRQLQRLQGAREQVSASARDLAEQRGATLRAQALCDAREAMHRARLDEHARRLSQQVQDEADDDWLARAGRITPGAVA